MTYPGSKLILLSTLTCFLVMFIILVASISGPIGTVNHEISDFAANGLLIQQAKDSWLLTGNYSRVGFNHPGPAILYVLAAGEFILFDKLGIVRSPFSGQLVAVVAYNAFWIALAFRILLIYLRQFSLAIFALAVILTSLAVSDHQILNGIWFPHLYVMPFCVAMLSLAVLISGRIETLPTLALATGFLVNGHVSFIPFLFVLYSFAYLAASAIQGFGKGSISDALFSRKNAALVSFSVLIVLFFFLPVIILTITEFPGPVASYASFGGGHKSNSSRDAINYVMVYWGSAGAFFVALIFALASGVVRFSNKNAPETVYFAIVIGLSTLCLYLYAKFGIDMLSEVYIGEFYYSAPAILACVAAIVFANFAPVRTAYYVGVPVVTLCVVIFIGQIFKNTTYENLYNDTRGLEVYNSLTNLKSPSRIVLDLTIDQHWGDTWSTILGAQLVAAREGKELICINKGWHISFTKKLQCTNDELKYSDRYYVRNASLPKPTSSISTLDYFETGKLRFERWSRPVVANKGYISLSAEPGIFDYYFLKSGWSSVESQFAWSVGSKSSISLPVGKGYSGDVVLDLEAFLPSQDLSQSITLSDGVSQNLQTELNHGNSRKQVTFHVEEATSDVIDIDISVQYPRSPKSLGLSADDRALGVAIYGFDVK